MSPKRAKSGRLRHKILFLVLPLALIPFALTALAVYYFVVDSYRIQMDEAQNKLLAQAVAEIKKEQERARKDAALIAALPTTKEYLHAASSQDGTPVESLRVKESAARGVLQMFFEQSPSYLGLHLVDAKGQERIKLSKLPGDQALRLIRDQQYFKKTLIRSPIQMPPESVQSGRFASIFTCQVLRESFVGIVVIQLNMTVFERSLRPLLSEHGLSTFLFDDRGLVFDRCLSTQAEEDFVQGADLAAQARALLTSPELESIPRTVKVGGDVYSYSVLPAEEFIGFIEPIPGENWFLGVLRRPEVFAGQVRSFQIAFVLILTAAIGAVFWATRWYAGRIAVPLEKVAIATEEIARGRFDISLDIRTGDEVEDLAEAVQRMARDLKRYHQELIRAAKLATIGEMASEMAHEFQNRISGLSLWFQLLESEITSDDPRRSYLNEMKQGFRSFIELLESMKQVYKTPILHLLEVNPNEIVRDALRYATHRLDEAAIALCLDLAPELPLLRCDPEKVTSVLLNLLINAIEAVPRGGHIELKTMLTEQGGSPAIQFSVTDDGCGIGESDLQRIFYPFYSTKSGGSGLGLAIASNIVTAHGGRIGAAGRTGAGSIFTVILPLTPPPVPVSDSARGQAEEATIAD